MTTTSSTAGTAAGVTGFILAGGQSRRMGVDKATLAWNRRTLLDQMVQLLSTVAEQVRIVGRGDLPDRIPGQGPLGGILTALEATSTERNLVLGVDLPLLTPDFLQMFRARLLASAAPLVACRIGTEYPLCLGIDRTLRTLAAQHIADSRLAIYDFIEAVDPEIISEAEIRMAGFDKSIFANVNTPEDWQRLQKS